MLATQGCGRRTSLAGWRELAVASVAIGLAFGLASSAGACHIKSGSASKASAGNSTVSAQVIKPGANPIAPSTVVPTSATSPTQPAAQTPVNFSSTLASPPSTPLSPSAMTNPPAAMQVPAVTPPPGAVAWQDVPQPTCSCTCPPPTAPPASTTPNINPPSAGESLNPPSNLNNTNTPEPSGLVMALVLVGAGVACRRRALARS